MEQQSFSVIKNSYQHIQFPFSPDPLLTRKSFDFSAGHHYKLKKGFSEILCSISLEQFNGCSSPEVVKAEMQCKEMLMLNTG